MASYEGPLCRTSEVTFPVYTGELWVAFLYLAEVQQGYYEWVGRAQSLALPKGRHQNKSKEAPHPSSIPQLLLYQHCTQGKPEGKSSSHRVVAGLRLAPKRSHCCRGRCQRGLAPLSLFFATEFELLNHYSTYNSLVAFMLIVTTAASPGGKLYQLYL